METNQALLEDTKFEEAFEADIAEAYEVMYEGFLDCNMRDMMKDPRTKKDLKEMIQHFSIREEFEKCGVLNDFLKKYSK